MILVLWQLKEQSKRRKLQNKKININNKIFFEGGLRNLVMPYYYPNLILSIPTILLYSQ